MRHDFENYKNYFYETLDESTHEELLAFDLEDDEQDYDFHFERIRDKRIREFEVNGWHYFEDWLDRSHIEYAY